MDTDIRRTLVHTNNIYHGDLTGVCTSSWPGILLTISLRQSNVLIDHNGDALVSDYGLASIMAEFNYTAYFRSCRPNALRWTDPDLLIALAQHDRRHSPALHGEHEDRRYDIYSLGGIILQVRFQNTT